MSKFETSETSNRSMNLFVGAIAGLGLALNLVSDQPAEPAHIHPDRSIIVDLYNDTSRNSGGTPLYSDDILNSW